MNPTIDELDQKVTVRERAHSRKAPTNWRWWTIALRGLAAIVFGLIALSRPSGAFVALVIVFGVYAVIDGIFALSLGSNRLKVSRSISMGRGLVSLIAGVVALAWPGMTAFALLMVIGVWAVVSGILEVANAIRLREHIDDEWLLGIEGVVSIIFGIALLLAPVVGVIVIGLWIGAYALVLGGTEISTAFRVRSWVNHHPNLAVV